jgi:hypothetical protein
LEDSRNSFSSLASQMNVIVKNTFLDIEVDGPSPRRRATSAPPSLSRVHTEEQSQYEVVASDGCKNNGQGTLADNEKEAKTRTSLKKDAQIFQPASLQPVIGCLVPGFANVSAPTQQPMQTPVFENANAAALWQSAQQAERAAAALRAQARLVTRKSTGRPEEFVDAENEPTSVMLRNIPNDLTREM